MKEMIIGTSFEATTIVNSTNTAITAGSGSLPVFGTPFLIALMEKATCDAAADFLEKEETTVGTAIHISHSKASGIGTVVTAKAVISEISGRKITFDVSASDEHGDCIGSGRIERFVVSANKFMQKDGGNEI